MKQSEARELMVREGWGLIVGTRHTPKVWARRSGIVFQTIQREARGYRLLQRTPLTTELLSVGVFSSLSHAANIANQEAVMRNPGTAWHEREERQAESMIAQAERAGNAGLAEFYHGKQVAHRESGHVARGMKDNPLAVFSMGNPARRKAGRGVLKEISAQVAGVIYNRCLEVRAEKTGYKRGLYRHPFSRRSGVQILALDNGDLLLHSVHNIPLWKQD